jgi:hypothetical protein
MDIVEEKGALPFDAYRKFLEMIKGSDGKVYEYLGELRILVDDEKTYEALISKAERPDEFNRQCWEESASGFRFSHLVDIDSFYEVKVPIAVIGKKPLSKGLN